MTHTAKHTPLHKAVHAIPMLYAEAFAGSNNKEFVVELYKDAQLLETAAPAMYEALKDALELIRSLVAEEMIHSSELQRVGNCQANMWEALAQAEGKS